MLVMKTVNTPNGQLSVASSSRILGAALVDLLVVSITIMCVIAILQKLGLILPQWLLSILGLSVFLYTLLAHKNLIFSFGNWGLGLRCYSYDLIEEYSGSGTLYVSEDLPKSVLYRRTIMLAVYLGTILYILKYLENI